MKKWIVLIVIAALPMCLLAQITGDKVADTPHNLTKAALMGVSDWGEICIYCHTPHNNNSAIDAPLWNRNTPAEPYIMYNSATLDMTIASSPQGGSLACLSCHDNTIALDQIINVPPSGLGITSSGNGISSCTGFCHAIHGTVNFDGTNLSTDLSNDHPISITYDPTMDSRFQAAVDGKIGGILPLYGPGRDQVECASCHNPHDNSNRPFLRMNNANSVLCTTCHDI